MTKCANLLHYPVVSVPLLPPQKSFMQVVPSGRKKASDFASAKPARAAITEIATATTVCDLDATANGHVSDASSFCPSWRTFASDSLPSAYALLLKFSASSFCLRLLASCVCSLLTGFDCRRLAGRGRRGNISGRWRWHDRVALLVSITVHTVEEFADCFAVCLV
jgi:hypothetical protein